MIGFRSLSGEGTSATRRAVDLEQTSWPRLLFAFLSQRFSGRVELQGTERKCTVVFSGGFAVWSDYDAPQTVIADVLATGGVEVSDEVATLIRETSDEVELLQALAELGALTEDAMGLAYRDQVEARVEAIFALATGVVELVDGVGLPDAIADVLVPARMLRVLQQGVAYHYAPQRLSKEMGAVADGAFEVSSSVEKYRERFCFTITERQALDKLLSLDPLRLDVFTTSSDLDPVRAAQLLFTLWACGMLTPIEDSATASPPRSSPSQPAARKSREPSASMSAAARLQQRVAAGKEPHAILGLGDDATLVEIQEASAALLASLDDGNSTRRELQEAKTAVASVQDAARARRNALAEPTAAKLLREERYAEAIPVLEELLLARPGDPKIRANLAWSRFRSAPASDRERKRTADALGKIVGDDPELGIAFYYRGLLLQDLGHHPSAIASFERAVEIDRSNVDAQRRLRMLKQGPSSGGSTVAGSKPAASRAKTSAPQRTVVSDAADTHVLWTPRWKRLWALFGVLALALIIAQVVLRMNF